ncbi:Major Facilitator Superfamily protein [Planctomycetes bacterium K23_9]|uniref:Major Facilitator Superfamily protein n=2 Tax=Stieleria marina TaxID=1930275 RepID=A0A517NQC9_9BACT|nr:Major Facilitator Superfamily protein [Planctomycetes bacterium K23_9]
MSILQRFENHIVGELTDHERTTLRCSAAWFFLVLFGYYILRPIREQISTEYGIKNLSWLFYATLATMLIAIPTYSLLVSKFHRRKLVPSIYAFFCVALLFFWAAMSFVPKTAMIGGTPTLEWVARFLFIWISVYGLFIVSFFWSVVGDMLAPEQGRRLYGMIAGGGTAGGMIASLVATFMVDELGQENLLLIPVVLLVVGLLVYFRLEKAWESQQASAVALPSSSGKPTGGNPFAGFTAVFSSRYLFAICLYGLFLATCGTTIYFQQSEIVEAAFDTKEAKTKYFAMINFAVQVLTLVLQTAVVGRLMKRFGLGLTLAILPIAYICGITSLAIAPTLAVLAVISVTGRSAEYAIANPAREVLFTAVRREDRYKAKSFIDTIVRRSGDASVGTVYRLMRESWGIAMTTLSWCIIPIAIAWCFLAWFIGYENKRVIAELDDQVQADND